MPRNIIGLHNHVVEQKDKQKFLQECMAEQADIISITDHRTLISYYNLFANLTKEEREQFKHLRFVLGMELTGMLDYITVNQKQRSVPVDLLAYNIDINSYPILFEFIQKAYSNIAYMDSPEYQQKELDYLIDVAKKLGFKADYDNIKLTADCPFSSRAISYALLDPKYVEFNLKNGLLPELVTNPRGFKNRETKDPESAFFIDTAQFYPNVDDVINTVHKANGLVFVPHAAAYFAKAKDEKRRKVAWENSFKLAHDFVEEKPVDGLEIVHPSFMDNDEYYEYLSQLAQSRGLGVSGGTDYHKSGEPITKDYKGNLITDKRLYNVNDWAKIYTIDEIIALGEEIAKIESDTVARAGKML